MEAERKSSDVSGNESRLSFNSLAASPDSRLAGRSKSSCKRSKGNGPLSPSSQAAMNRIGITARKNLDEMFEGSDSPQELRSALANVAKEDPKLTFAMLRFGWEKTLQIRRDRAVSMGFVGALIFSTALQMAVQPLEPSRNLLEASSTDFWSDVRPTFEDTYSVLITLGATFSAISVVNSALYVLWLQIYVSDADDFIWFCKHYRVTRWVDVPMALALICSVLAVAASSVAVNADPVASITFFSVMSLVVFSILSFLFGVVPGERRMRENFENMLERYEGYIEEAFAKLIQDSKKVETGSI